MAGGDLPGRCGTSQGRRTDSAHQPGLQGPDEPRKEDRETIPETGCCQAAQAMVHAPSPSSASPAGKTLCRDRPRNQRRASRAQASGRALLADLAGIPAHEPGIQGLFPTQPPGGPEHPIQKAGLRYPVSRLPYPSQKQQAPPCHGLFSIDPGVRYLDEKYEKWRGGPDPSQDVGEPQDSLAHEERLGVPPRGFWSLCRRASAHPSQRSHSACQDLPEGETAGTVTRDGFETDRMARSWESDKRRK